jgi:hypothetical protein
LTENYICSWEVTSKQSRRSKKSWTSQRSHTTRTTPFTRRRETEKSKNGQRAIMLKSSKKRTTDFCLSKMPGITLKTAHQNPTAYFPSSSRSVLEPAFFSNHNFTAYPEVLHNKKAGVKLRVRSFSIYSDQVFIQVLHQ